MPTKPARKPATRSRAKAKPKKTPLKGKRSVPLPPGTREIATFKPEPNEFQLPPLPQQIEQIIREQVIAGYKNDRELNTCLLGALEDQASPREIKRIAKPLIARHRLALRAEQAQWPKTTDCDRLDNAFAKLEKSGILARQNYWCCGTCGCDAIDDEMSKQSKRRAVRGYAFFHEQDTESAAQGYGLMFNYGSLSGKKDDSLAVGNQIVKALTASGLKPKWNGRLDTRIALPMKWQRRR